ncbi:hypothetical protein O181_118107 [Austropuccinia psidii MF-1]|uniref:Uncharacterized protein n=1 Tax=Austropuccinia psidii MF-1 TaxID=1389203 RepID=A0A9Q3Q027_9BASI|nr:hypothetical protein [Austropuccinia psidii MF-1]
MSHTLTYHGSQNVQLRHHHIGRGIGPYAHAYAQVDTHAHAPTPAHAHTNAHANATAPHPRYYVAGSTSVICKMTIPRRWSPFMDDLVR